MAEFVDTHTYDPKYKGAKAQIDVANVDSVPGHGVVRQNTYIPTDEVQNVSTNPGQWIAWTKRVLDLAHVGHRGTLNSGGSFNSG